MSNITLEVLAEKIEGLSKLTNEKTDGIKEFVGLKFKENSKQHYELSSRQDSYEKRTSALERWRYSATGIFVAVNVIFLPILFIIVSIYFNKK